MDLTQDSWSGSEEGAAALLSTIIR
ncbi:MAG: hypothetical protein V7633_1541, partial [Pseudonocardia sp.]